MVEKKVMEELIEKIKSYEYNRNPLQTYEGVSVKNCAVDMDEKDITCDVAIVDLESDVTVMNFGEQTYTFKEIGFNP